MPAVTDEELAAAYFVVTPAGEESFTKLQGSTPKAPGYIFGEQGILLRLLRDFKSKAVRYETLYEEADFFRNVPARVLIRHMLTKGLLRTLTTNEVCLFQLAGKIQ